MEKKLFRKSFFGGFNKKDVEIYIKTLEEELEKNQFGEKGLTKEEREIIDESIFEIKNLKLEKEEMETYIRKLEEELKEKKRNEKITEEMTFDSINNEELEKLREENQYLKEKLNKINEEENSREIIRRVLTDARLQAKEIIEKAEKQAETRKQKAREELRVQLENKVIDFLSLNYQLTDFSEKVDLICNQLKGVSSSIHQLHKEIPNNIEKILEKTDDTIRKTEITEFSEDKYNNCAHEKTKKV